MKILLIQPSDIHIDGSLKGGVWHAFPLGIASLAAFLRHRNHIPRILDLAMEDKDPEEICKEFKPDYIGFSVTTPLYGKACAIAKKLKANFPKSKIIFGGPHSSVDIEGVLKQNFVDFVVFGEGELTLAELVDSRPLSDIKGLSYKSNGKVIKNPARELIKDLDGLPMPAYDLLSIDRYPNHPLSIRRPNASIITSRGCPFGCPYCNKSIFGRTFRKMSYKKVVDQMQHLVDKYGIKEFQIVDDVFTLDTKRIWDICSEILKRRLKIKWMTPNGVRTEGLELDTLKIMKRSGCHYLYIGIESGSPRILERINKGITTEGIRRSVQLINKTGIKVGAFFMIGLPDETEEDIRKTIDFAKSLPLDSVKFGILVPLPGTEVFEEFSKKGFIKNFDYSSYFWHKEPVFETNLLSKEALFGYYKKAYREFYMRPQYVLRKIFTSCSLNDARNIFNGAITLLHNQLSKN